MWIFSLVYTLEDLEHSVVITPNTFWVYYHLLKDFFFSLPCVAGCIPSLMKRGRMFRMICGHGELGPVSGISVMIGNSFMVGVLHCIIICFHFDGCCHDISSLRFVRFECITWVVQSMHVFKSLLDKSRVRLIPLYPTINMLLSKLVSSLFITSLHSLFG